ncbi:hypothetical protein WSM22_15390 [Cytophagales bacterium WSM2-2]|nr:hypothetical protein WSM22_15390 [Cytophagales bacterium WSM2-2]
MKKIIVALLLLFSCSEKPSTNSLAPTEFDAKLKSTPAAVLLDVRTEAEVQEGSLPKAQNIVYDDAFASKLEDLSKDVPVLVYCAKGMRSEKAAAILKEKGFKEVYQLKGGLQAWKEAGLPL